jgi:DNA modification methylase
MVSKKQEIICGDSFTVLKSLPDKIIQTCVTSPPYWGLRDYGTAKWEGGNGECDHKVGRFTTPHSGKQGPNAGSGDVQARDVCPKCGAVRLDQQLGLESSLEEYVSTLVKIMKEVRRVLRDDGTLWLNLGDSYYNYRPGNGTMVKQTVAKTDQDLPTDYCARRATRIEGLKEKDLVGIPWRVAFALQEDGWYLRSDIIWSKKNAMPESVKDRPTKSHEHIFLLAKSSTYYYDQDAIREPMSEVTLERDKYAYSGAFKGQFKGTPDEDRFQDGKPLENPNFYNPDGRNKRDVWTVNTKPFPEAHFAVYPQELIEPCVLAGSKEGDFVLDPFAGSGTTGIVAIQNRRKFIGIELSPKYCKITEKRLKEIQVALF